MYVQYTLYAVVVDRLSTCSLRFFVCSFKALAEAPHTPVSSPPYATSIPVVVMDTQDETEDDTPTRIKKGRSFLTSALILQHNQTSASKFSSVVEL